MRTRFSLLVLSLPMIALSPLAVLAGDESPSPSQMEFFEKQIRPILAEFCLECHGEKTQWASLRLDSKAAMLQGGDSGPAIAPGDPAASLLIRAVRQVDESLKMPQDGKLSETQIAALENWIENGAVFPEAAASEAISERRLRDPSHWAFQLYSPSARELPDHSSGGFPAPAERSPIDRFIQERLAAAGITPAPEADKTTLIRRVTFDLTGLPPTPEEIDAFLADERDDAWFRLIDRLLASPAYGERWGRHWLDVARYADSNGLDENVAHGNAWRYRDYVVASFASDKPYDQFLVEQLAGDLLPAETQAQRHERLIATGFLSIGPKVLAEVDQAKMQMDIVDEQLDTFGRVFLGMTFGCARCHDHKFDPIDSADYYGMAGIFKSTRTMETYTKVAKWNENLLESAEATAKKQEYDARLAAKKEQIAQQVADAEKAVRDSRTGDAPLPETLEELFSEEAKAQLKTLRDELSALEKAPPDLPAAMGVGEDAIVDVAIHLRGNPLKLGDVAPRRAPAVFTGDAALSFTASESGRLTLARWLADPSKPFAARVYVNRLWRWHFGEGIVRTTDNFGLLGDPPSHPKLLDWMAQRFTDDGWSTKHMHRLLLDSATYRQASSASPETLAADPENRLFSRAPLRRLEAEELRDALLAASGELDRALGGTLLKVANRGYFFDHTSIDTTDYASRRRTLYLPVVRNNVYDVLQLLDFPDPAVATGDRSTTTVAPQALLMLNSDLVMQAAEKLAAQLAALSDDDASRIDRLYWLAYGRGCAPEEAASQQAFLKRIAESLSEAIADLQHRRAEALTALCHLVLASNEFIYLK